MVVFGKRTKILFCGLFIFECTFITTSDIYIYVYWWYIASSPVVKGDKWVGVKLMHVKAKDLTQEVMYIFIILNCI